MSAPKRGASMPAIPIPREHGAWGLLLQPFVAAAILARFWHWLLLPSLGLVLLGFMLKEPLLVLARQRWVWRSPNPQTPLAWRWLAAELSGITVCLVVLCLHVPILPLALLSAVAFTLTLTAVWYSLKNKQRSLFLQLLSAGGLSTSALLVALVSHHWFPPWSWQLWTILTAHAAASILVIHTRLDRIAARRSSSHNRSAKPTRFGSAALLAQGFQAAAALAGVASGFPQLALPLMVSAIANVSELYRMQHPASLDEPLKRVGFRTLGISLAHMLVSVVAMWPHSQP